MGNFSQKVDKFIEIFLNQNGYVKVLQGIAEYFDDRNLRSHYRYCDRNSDRNSKGDPEIQDTAKGAESYLQFFMWHSSEEHLW